MDNAKKTMEKEIEVKSVKELHTELLDGITVETSQPVALTGEKKNISLFSAVKNSVANPILVNRVVSVNSLLKLSYKDYLIMSVIKDMPDTNQLTYKQIIAKTFPKIEPKKVSLEGMSIEYRSISGKVSDRDIEKAVILLVALGCNLHLTYNKNGECSVRHEETKQTLIKPSLFVPVEYTDKETKETKIRRKTVVLKDIARLAILEVFSAISYDIGLASLKIKLGRLAILTEPVEIEETKEEKKENIA